MSKIIIMSHNIYDLVVFKDIEGNWKGDIYPSISRDKRKWISTILLNDKDGFQNVNNNLDCAIKDTICFLNKSGYKVIEKDDRYINMF